MRVRPLLVCVIAFSSAYPMRAQDAAERTEKALQVLRKTIPGEIRVTDYRLVHGATFKDAELSAATRQRIVAALPNAFFDDFPYEGSLQNAIDKSHLYDLGSLPEGYRLYALLFDTGASNGAIAIVEASAHQAKFLGEAGGWGIRAVPNPGELYPILVIPHQMSAVMTTFAGFLFSNGVYDAAVCGVEDESGLSWSLC